MFELSYTFCEIIKLYQDNIIYLFRQNKEDAKIRVCFPLKQTDFKI